MAEKKGNWIYAGGAWKRGRGKPGMSVSLDVAALEEALEAAPRQSRTVSGKTYETIRGLLMPPREDDNRRRGRNAPDAQPIISRQAPAAGARDRQRDTEPDDDLPF